MLNYFLAIRIINLHIVLDLHLPKSILWEKK
jgi:hypothetical protein